MDTAGSALRLIAVLATFATLTIVAGQRPSSLVLPHSGNLQEPNCSASFSPVGTSCLHFVNELTLDHTEAQFICDSMGGHLVVIDTAQKFNDVVDYIRMRYNNLQKSYWIDGDRNTANQWSFSTSNFPFPMGTPFWGTSKNYGPPNYGWVQRPLNNSGDCLIIPYDKSYYFTETTCDSEMHSPLCEQEISWSSCGGVYEGPEGTIVSPNYPSNYQNNANCQWVITSDVNTTITVHFETFDTENRYDYLVIRDGNNISAPELVRLTGYHSSIDDVVSSSNSLFFHFTSDGSAIRSGFKLNWYTGSPVTCPPFYTKIGQDCFAFVFIPMPYNQAKITCSSMNGQLGKITNVEQLRSIYVYIHDLDIADVSFWLGGSDKKDEGQFVYEDGTNIPQGTPFWGTIGESSEIQEPDDGSQQENCVALLAEGFYFLRDVPCTTQMKFLCSPL